MLGMKTRVHATMLDLKGSGPRSIKISQDLVKCRFCGLGAVSAAS